MENQISILFDVYHLYHLAQFDPLIDLLENDNRFKIFFSTSSKNRKEEIEICTSILNKRKGSFIFHENEDIRKTEIKKLNLDVFICGWSRYEIESYVSKTTLVIMIYHGIGVKPSYWRDNNKRLDVRFVEGQYRIDQLRKHGVDTDLVLTGYIKLDSLFNENSNYFKEKEELLGLDESKKTILYAPTFYPSSLEKLGLSLGDITSGYNLIIKPHMWTYYLDSFGGISLKGQRSLIFKLIDQFDHIRLLEPAEYNVTPYYKISDLLLTDASSTIYEMIALSKPVVVNRFYHLKLSHRIFQKRLYKRRLDKEMNDEVEKFCFLADNVKQLPLAIEKALNQNNKNTALIKEYQKKMLYKLDGSASIRARDEILKRINR
jgi:flagellar biosynthesis/type III secretory pathway chaperone